jgi:hypothetical protein
MKKFRHFFPRCFFYACRCVQLSMQDLCRIHVDPTISMIRTYLRCNQADQMSSWKVALSVAQPFFVKFNTYF